MNGGEVKEWVEDIWGYICIYTREFSTHAGSRVNLCNSMESGAFHLVPRTTFPIFFMILVLRLIPGDPGSCGTPA